MSDKEFTAMLTLFMRSDPWPLVKTNNSDDGYLIIKGFLNRESEQRGFNNWVEAYYNFVSQQEKTDDSSKNQ